LAAQKQKSKAVIGLMSLVAVFFVVLVIFSVYTVKVFKNVDGDGGGFNLSSKSSDSIGVIEVNGVIFDSKDLVELIQKAEEDKSVKAIVMRVNSPGGAVAPTQEVYDEIRRIDDSYTTSKGKEGKPVYASFSSVAASGGYYLGAATRKICALPGTITGSIGVIMQFMDLSKLYEFARVNPQTIKAGKYKDIGQPSRSLTEEEFKLMTTMTAGVHKQFIRDIEKTRKDKNELMNDLFELFSEKSHWTVKSLKDKLDQPELFLKEVLSEICNYCKSGPKKGNFALKDQYVGKKDNNI